MGLGKKKRARLIEKCNPECSRWKRKQVLATESDQGEGGKARRANMSCAGQDSVDQAVWWVEVREINKREAGC